MVSFMLKDTDDAKDKRRDQTTLETKLVSFPGYYIWFIEHRTHFLLIMITCIM